MGQFLIFDKYAKARTHKRTRLKKFKPKRDGLSDLNFSRNFLKICCISYSGKAKCNFAATGDISHAHPTL